MLPGFDSQTLTRLRPGMSTVYGQTRLDPANPVVVELSGWSIQPGAGRTDLELRFGVRADYVCYGPPDADVLGTDQFRVPGDTRTFKVTAGPQVWQTGLPLDHVVILLEGWEG